MPSTQVETRPSRSHVWMACALSAHMFGRYGERYPAGEAADEGTEAHTVAEAMVLGLPVPETATDEMIDAGQALADFFTGRGVVPMVEQSVHLTFGEFEVKGKADYFVSDPAEITDLKFGHRHVAADATQLKLYACAQPDVDTMLRVFQPRDYTSAPWREHLFTAADRKVFKMRVQGQLERIHATDSPGATTGPHCVDCPGAGGMCNALRNDGLQALARPQYSSAEPLTPDGLSMELSLAYRCEELAVARRKGLEQEVSHVVRTGGVVPGWTMQRGLGREYWIDPTQAREFAALFAVSIDKPALITPNQAIKAGLPADLVRMHTDRKPGEPKVVPSEKSAALKAFQEN